MKQELPTLSDFRMIETLGKHKKIRSAAKELDMPPSSLSRQLSLLEEKLGITIFDRNTRNLYLTNKGKEFLVAAKNVLETTELVMDKFNNHLNAKYGQLTVATLPIISCALLPSLLKEFMSKHQDIDVTVIDLLSYDIIEAINNGNVDIGIMDATESIRSKLSFTPLFKYEYVIISGKDDSSVNKKEYTLEEISKFPLILPVRGNGMREFMETLFKRNKLELNPRIEISHISTAIGMAAEGLGVILIPSLVLPVFRNECIKVHKIRDSKIDRQVGIAFRTGKSLSPSAKNFVKHIKQEIKPLHQSLMKSVKV